MEKPPNIIINSDIDSLIYTIFENYFLDAYENDTYKPRSLNQTVNKLYYTLRNRNYPFDDNIIDGIKYLFMIMYDNVCKDCDDKALVWLYRLAKKWVSGDEPPKFKKCVCK